MLTIIGSVEFERKYQTFSIKDLKKVLKLENGSGDQICCEEIALPP
jgi:hypothetical protein